MSQPIRSMTGYARVHQSTGCGDITVTLKSVNHRGLDLHFHLDSELDPLEGAMRAVLKRGVLRGHVDIRCTVARNGGATISGLNETLFRSYLAAFRKAAEQEGIEAVPDLNQVFRIPGMFGSAPQRETDEALEGAVVAVVEETMKALNDFRSREGSELASFLRTHNRMVAECAVELEDIRSRAIPAFQQRLSDRMQEVLRNSSLDPQRIAQEAALLADRSDIGEEIARLKIHSRQLDEILDSGGEVGKKLDFLLQEMNRESNTILSKTTGIGETGLRITDLALAAKAAIEKIREQALNLE